MGRRLNKEIINLDLMTEIDASVFVLDCLPNLHDIKKFPDAEIEKRLVNAVKTSRSVYPSTPIVMTEHATNSIYQPGNLKNTLLFELKN